MSKLILISGGKGGVGKSFITANLAAILSDFGKDVTIIDGDITTANLCVQLGISSNSVTLQEVLNGSGKLRDSLYEHPSGFKIVPTDIGIQKEDMDISDMIELLIRLLGINDYVLIDSPPTLNKDSRELMEIADSNLLVTNPELSAVTDCLKTFKIAEDVGTHSLGIILNNVRNRNYEIENKDIEDMVELPIIANIPHDKAVLKSLNLKSPVVHSYPYAKSSIELKKFVADFIGEDYEPPADIVCLIKRILSQ